MATRTRAPANCRILVHRPFPDKMNNSSASAILPPSPPDPLYTLRPHAGEVTDLKFLNHSDGSLIIGTTTGRLGLWDLSSKRELWHHKSDSAILAVDTIPTNKLVLSQMRNNVIASWDMESQSQLSSMRISRTGFCKLAVLQTSNEGIHKSTIGLNCFIVAHPEYGKVNVYDNHTQKNVATFSVETPENRGMCMCVCMYMGAALDVVYGIGGFEDGSIVIWDSRQPHKELASIKLFPEPVMCMAMDHDKCSIVAGSPTNNIVKISVSPHLQDVLHQKFSVELKNSGVASLAIRSDAKIFCTGGWDGRIRIFGWKKGKPLAVLNYHSSTVNTCSFLPNTASTKSSNLIVCGSKDERVSMWKIY